MDCKEQKNHFKTRAVQNLTDDADFSTACRQFYQSRRMAAEAVKEKLAASGRQGKLKATAVDTAMETLRTEMVTFT